MRCTVPAAYAEAPLDPVGALVNMVGALAVPAVFLLSINISAVGNIGFFRGESAYGVPLSIQIRTKKMYH